ncbi:type II secretion system F family protein [Gordonia sp. CPCC 205333]|uniref:type II secretion system F family protein n=1 Tax=Gordonia sp. CPCC 205333 TaxID=3140790 RepID=UPI003AF35543
MVSGLWCVVGAFGVLWWPLPKSRYRLGAVVGSEARKSRRLGVVGLGAVPLGFAVAVGPSVGLSAAVLTALSIWLRRRLVRRSRGEQEREALAAALSAISAELSIGTPPPAAFAFAGQELTERHSVVARRLRTIAARTALGGSIGNGVGWQGSSIEPEWRRVALAWEIASEFGVPIKDLLDAVRSDLNSRRSFAARTNAGLAGPRATATVLALLPVLGIGLGQALGAQPVVVLCRGGIGGILLVVGTALGAAGVWWSLRIADHVLAQG